MKNLNFKIGLHIGTSEIGYTITLNNRLVILNDKTPTLGKVNIFDKKLSDCLFKDTEQVRTFFMSLITQINSSVGSFYTVKIKNEKNKTAKKQYRWNSIVVNITHTTRYNEQIAHMLMTSIADAINNIPFFNGEPKINYNVMLNPFVLTIDYRDCDMWLRNWNINPLDLVITREVKNSIKTWKGE